MGDHHSPLVPTEQILPDRSQRCLRALVIIENCETLLFSVIPESNVLLSVAAACLSSCPTGFFPLHLFVGPIASAKRNISSFLMWISRDHITTRTPVDGEALASLRPTLYDRDEPPARQHHLHQEPTSTLFYRAPAAWQSCNQVKLGKRNTSVRVSWGLG